jgi:hypothetical protein
MNRLIFSLACSLASMTLFGQQIDPVATEQWEPVPPLVTPGENNSAPSDAIVLFDGKSLNEWTNEKGQPAEWDVKDGIVTVTPGKGIISTKRPFGDCQLHIEWRAPAEVKGDGQGRGNSGIFLMGLYELQVLDCYNNKTYSNGQAGSLYKQHIPLVNACKKPGEWQSYDIIFTAPRFGESNRIVLPGTVTVLQNGILVQNHVYLTGSTQYIGLPKNAKHDLKLPLSLQDHGNPVSYRNIWIREL